MRSIIEKGGSMCIIEGNFGCKHCIHHNIKCIDESMYMPGGWGCTIKENRSVASLCCNWECKSSKESIEIKDKVKEYILYIEKNIKKTKDLEKVTKEMCTTMQEFNLQEIDEFFGYLMAGKISKKKKEFIDILCCNKEYNCLWDKVFAYKDNPKIWEERVDYKTRCRNSRNF